MKALWMVLALLASAPVHAEVIEFPDEELATESVLPVFDHPVAVKARNVVTEKRIELGAMGGYNLTEAFFNQLSFGGTATYHLTEEHGINVFASYNLPGETSYVPALNPPPGSNESLNLQYAPRPKWMILGSYQYTGFYGKMSFSKDAVMNLSLYGLAGVGGIYIGDKTFPVLSVGLGQKFYFSPNFALRFDLRALIYQGPDLFAVPKSILSTATSEQSASRFTNRLHIGSILNAGVIWLVPGT
ncbi:MAG: outer membrane beta-barrel domain-containing protein [Bdellovibrionaceae bacterium]|nr:outer membrane beta-barrel domain-containing protein [Pseudobdellovibrionaceae bacterium]